MVFLLAFWVFVAASLGLSWRAAQPYDKRLILVIVAAIIATLLADASLGVESAAPWVLVIDLGLLMFLVYHSLQARTYWPLWFAGLHGVTVITDLSASLFANTNLSYFQTLAGFWAIPALVVMALGTHRDRKMVNRS